MLGAGKRFMGSRQLRRSWAGVLGSFLATCALAIGASVETPRVIVLGGADDALREEFKRSYSGTTFDSATPAGLEQALARESWNKDAARPAVLFTVEPSGMTEKDRVRAISELAREIHRRGCEPLWYWAEDEAEDQAVRIRSLLEKLKVMEVAVPAPPRSSSGREARVRFAQALAEAVGQWAVACAVGNPDVAHEKLWRTAPPAFVATGPERVNKSSRIDHVAEPELLRFFPKRRDKAPAILFFPGGGYAYVGFLRNAKELAERLDSTGVAVFGLKYRTGRPREIPLLDAQRAVRMVRAHADEWGIDPRRIGVAGQSAGADLILNLLGNSSLGDADAADLIERQSCRPDFAIVLTSWYLGRTEAPYAFPPTTPPVFLRHARNDPGFPIAERVVRDLQGLGISLDFKFLPSGGHGAFEIAPQNPGANWPDDLVPWLRTIAVLGPETRR